MTTPATKTDKTGAPATPPASDAAAEPPMEAKKPAKSSAKAATKAGDAQPKPSTPTASATATPAAVPAQPDNTTVALSAVKSVAKATAQVADQLPASLAQDLEPALAAPVAKTPVKVSVKAAPKIPAKAPDKAPEKAAPILVEPTPRPLGKRAAKKVMMEQMTQAAVVPTHAPNAAKATFSTMNERAVMTPPVPSSIKKDPTRADNWKSLSVEQLTDQDVLAMPDSEYMSDLQLAYFRRKLATLKADMLANAGETTEHLREDTVVVPDPADRATIEEEHALELRTRDRERKLLKKIEQAIARIDAGDYGYCEETGEVIGVGRLMARPTASLSLEAQQRRELKQKMFGD